MIFRFNKAQLGRERLAALESILERFQKGEEQEIEVSVDEFPDKFSIKAGEAVSVLQWKPEGEGVSAGFYFLPSPVPEPESESKTDTTTLPEPKPEPGPQVESSVDPVKLAEQTYDLVNENLKMSLEQRLIFRTAYHELWLKES